MRLSRFLTERAEEILREWVAFAKTLEPAALGMTSEALRDHAHQMLEAIALDIETAQSPAEQIEKSHGRFTSHFSRTATSVHGTLREVSGFSLVQLAAEFRALRACVLRLWLPHVEEFNSAVHEELVRFNEAVDQALAESAATYSAQTNRTRERFLAILGHDLRTPLAAIGLTGAALERSTSVAANETTGRILRRSAATMSAMINDLLEYSRTQLGGKMPVALVPANMGGIIQAALHDARTAHPECTIESHLRGDLAGSFDGVRIQQVVLNLLINAVQYRDPGTAVLLDVEGRRDDVVIAVSNKGPSIPPEAIDTVFSAMVQLPSGGERAGSPSTSLGLGLFIAREITLAHGGSIHVSSTDQEGTTFRVCIPREMA